MDLSLSTAASEELFIAKMPERIKKTDYFGKLLLPGDDMTITVTAQRIAVFLDGQISKVGRARKFVDTYVGNIRSETKAEFEAGCTQINIIGVWHYNGPNPKSFEPYLVQTADPAGNVTTSLYRYRIFHFDHHRSGERHGVTIEDLDDPRDAIDFFKDHTERSIPRDDIPDDVRADGHPCGILWCPMPGVDLPPFAYRSVGVKEYRTRDGSTLDVDEVTKFDAARYWASRRAYNRLSAKAPGMTH